MSMARKYKTKRYANAVLESERHVFDFQGVTRTGRDGRKMRICAVCDQPSNAPRHYGGRVRDRTKAKAAEAETPEEASLRQAILRAVAENGPFKTAEDVMDFVQDNPRKTNLHEVVHLLFSLNKSNLVAMKSSGPMGRMHVTDVRARSAAYQELGITTPAAREVNNLGTTKLPHVLSAHQHRGEEPLHRSDRTDFRTHRTIAEGGPVTVTKVAVPEPDVAKAEVSEWPILDRIRAVAAAGAENRLRAEKLMEAAAILEGISPDDSERLAKLAEETARETHLTATEIEYLAFAEAHKEE